VKGSSGRGSNTKAVRKIEGGAKVATLQYGSNRTAMTVRETEGGGKYLLTR